MNRGYMKVLHWNISKKNQPISGVKRYEEELFNNIRKIDPLLDIQKIQRLDNDFLGSTPVSWFYRYSVGDADIVHATYQTLAPSIHIKKPNKFIVTVHDLAPLMYPDLRYNFSTKMQWQLTPKALRRADILIAISEFTKQEIIRLCGIEENKIKVIYLGVDHEKYYPMDCQECKKQLGLNPDNRYILVVASNLPHKRMDLTKEIFDIVRKSRPDVKLIKVGYGDVLQGEGIINLGWVRDEDMPTLYNAADIFLHTAEYEGFGLPVLEAMSCGCAIVCRNMASIPEIIEDSGILITSEKVEEWTKSILDLFQNDDLKNNLQKSGIKRGKIFSWDKTAKETVDVYYS
jgi:glycosyltransferase involved in cell wall biosynthesis